MRSNGLLKFLCVAVCMLGFRFAGMAQTDKFFQFIYIVHDSRTSVQSLTRELNDYYETALAGPENVTVFYLSNGLEPIVVEINTDRDNRAEFSHLINEMQTKNSHDVNISIDLNRAVEIFNRIDFINQDDVTLKFPADWMFYVTSRFWELRYNEDLISSLCFIMGAEKFSPMDFQLKIYHAVGDPLNVNPEHPFGLKNYSKIKYYDKTYE